MSCGVSQLEWIKPRPKHVLSIFYWIHSCIKFSKLLQSYRAIALVVSTFGHGLANFCALCLTSVSLAGLFYSFVSIRMHSDSPIPLIVFRPCMAIMLITLAYLFLLQAQRFTEHGNQMRKELFEIAGRLRVGRKYVMRLIKTLNRTHFDVGVGDHVLFSISRATKATFFMVSITHTINALVGVPAHFVKRWGIWYDTC